MTTKSLTELGLSSADLAAIGKLSEKGMTPNEIADGIKKAHSIKKSAVEIDKSVDKKQMVLPKALIYKGKDIFNFNTLDGAAFFPVESSVVYSVLSESFFDGANVIELKDTVTRASSVTIPCDLSFMGLDYISLYVWADDHANFGNLTLEFSTHASNYANSCSIVLKNRFTPLPNHWNNIRIPINDLIFKGTANNQSLMKSFRLTTNSLAGKTNWIKFGGLKANAKPRTAITFSFDDSFETDFSVAHQKLKSVGFPFITYTISNLVGTSFGGQRLSISQLKQIIDEGSFVGLHQTSLASNFAEATLAEVDTMISECLKFLIDNGLENKGMYHLAYPHGAYNEDVIKVLKRYNVKSARTTNLKPQQSPVEDLYKLKLGIQLSQTLQENISKLENCIKYGGLINIYGHKMTGQHSVIDDISPEVFNAFVDYIYENYRHMVTSIPQWVEDYETGCIIE